jgi:tRNA(Ile)-lysidine synthase TilS/MesJ
MKGNAMTRCSRCVLPDTFPGIKFDSEGVCNYCRQFRGIDKLRKSMEKYRAKFERLLEKKRKRGGYDAIMAYSGGKDSTYTMAVLKKEYDMSILAVTMDNGFISPKSLENSRRVVEGIGVDHIIYKPRMDIVSRIFLRCADEDIYTEKGLERASSICTSCMGLVKFIALRMAIESNIPLITYGWSPGQAPIEASIFPNNPQMIRGMQEQLMEPMRRVAGDQIENYFLTEEHFSMEERFPHNVSPLAFIEYDEEDILEKIKSFGWEKPDDTDPNSTNCLLNALGIKVHKKRFNFHPYAFELAGLVRAGYMERGEAIKRLEEETNEGIVENVRRRLENLKESG